MDTSKAFYERLRAASGRSILGSLTSLRKETVIGADVLGTGWRVAVSTPPSRASPL